MEKLRRWGLLLAIAIGFVLGLLVGLALLQAPKPARKDATTWLKNSRRCLCKVNKNAIPPPIFFTIVTPVALIANLRK